MWIPSHVGIIPNVIADNLAAQEQEATPDGMITGLISKQVKSRPIIYSRKVMESIELANNPIYQEARKKEKKLITDTHKPPEGGNKYEIAIAREMVNGYIKEKEEVSDIERDIERQEGKRKVEKFVHGLRNGEIVGGGGEGKKNETRHRRRK
eukprot:6202213-Pleurochrysis_carterae.AAC.1